MAIIKWAPMLEPWEDLDKAWEQMLAAPTAGNFVPAIDVYQTKDEVVVETSLAGVDPEKVEVAIENDVLSIKGKMEHQSEVEEKNYYRKEIRSGSFYRSVALPTHVLGDKAQASFSKGILVIKVPKAPEVKPKTIKIKVDKK